MGNYLPDGRIDVSLPGPDGKTAAAGTECGAILQARYDQGRREMRPVFHPPGGWGTARPLTLDSCGADGLPNASKIYDVGALRAGQTLLTVTDTYGLGTRPVLSGLIIQGTGTDGPGMAHTGRPDGVSLTVQSLVENCSLHGFDSNLRNDCAGGHVTIRGTKSGGGRYNLYNAVQSGDLIVDGCDLTGASCASLGLAVMGGVHSSAFRDTPLGNSPYGVFKEAGTMPYGGPFVSDTVFDNCSWEAIGNAAFWDDNALAHDGPHSEFANVAIGRAGFSWASNCRIAGRKAGSPFHGDFIMKVVSITQGNNPFTVGPDGGPMLEFALPYPGLLLLDGVAVDIRTMLPAQGAQGASH